MKYSTRFLLGRGGDYRNCRTAFGVHMYFLPFKKPIYTSVYKAFLMFFVKNIDINI